MVFATAVVNTNYVCSSDKNLYSAFLWSGLFQGDSGGPLVCQDKNSKWKVTAIVSWGSLTCGAMDFPGIYTNVAHYRYWINAQMKKV